MIKVNIFILFISLCFASYSQRFSTGLVLGLNGFNRTTLPGNFVFSENSYHLYYASNPDKDGEPVFDQMFNGAFGAISGSIDYKRFMFTTEVGFKTSTIEIPLLYPSDLGVLLDNQMSNFKTSRNSFIVNALSKIRLSRKANGLFFMFGVQYASNYYNEKNQITDQNLSSFDDISSALWFYISENELYGTLYNNTQHYLNAITGLGYKKDNWFLSIRYNKRMAKREKLPLARFEQIELTLSRVISFQKLRKGYHIYME